MNLAAASTRMRRQLAHTLATFLVVGGLCASGPIAGQTSPAPDDRLPAIELPAGTEAAVTEQLAKLRELAMEQLDADESAGAEAVGELGRHYHAYGFADAARSTYELAASLQPRDFRWPYLLGFLAQNEGRLEDAMALYEKALAIVPGVSPALVRLASVYAELGNADKAEWLYGEALRANPTSAAAEAGLGELLLAQDRPKEAVVLLERALDKVREANRLYYPLALAYRKLGDEDKAREILAWRGSIGVKPADPIIDSLESLKTGERVFRLQGQAAFRVGRYREAAESFRKALGLDPDSIGAWIDLGSALGEMGQADEAIEAFERAVELAPGNETALYNLGVLLSRRGEYERAIDYLSRAGQLAPADGQLRYELARAMRLAGRWEDSIVHFDAAIQALPAQEAPRLGKVQALAELNDSARARQTLEEAVEAIPGSLVLSRTLSRLLVTAGDSETADGGRAVELAIKVFTASQVLGDAEWVAEALAESGRCDEAAGWQRDVVRLAVEAAQPEAVLSRLEESLERYQSGAPCSRPLAAP